jgi:D-aminopeptidase
MLGSETHWTDAGSPASEGEHAQVRRRERQLRVACLNRVLRAFACTVSDWQSSAYLVSTFTGKTEIVENLAQLWPAVERVSGRRVDPLAADLLDRLRQAS